MLKKYPLWLFGTGQILILLLNHPGVDPKELVHLCHGTVLSELNPEGFGFRQPSTGEIFCYNCGLKDSQATKGYSSRVKIKYIRHNNAIWELGGPEGPWLLRDDINTAKNHMSVDYAVQKFLRDANSTVPLVEMYRFGGGDEKYNFIMMSRAKGKPFDEFYKDLCDEQMEDLEADLVDQILKIRQFTSPCMQKVDGGELRDIHIGNCAGFPCVKTGRNEEEWLENLAPAMRKALLWHFWQRNQAGLRDPTVRDRWVKTADEQLKKLQANFPKGRPYVLTHGDLHHMNIYGSNDNAEKKWKVTAIIDWETAGYFPWWVEIVRNTRLQYDRAGALQLSKFCPPEFDQKDWILMLNAIRDVERVWSVGGSVSNVKHFKKGEANRWYSKEFCECRKTRRRFLEWDMGWPQEHHDIYDPELSDPE